MEFIQNYIEHMLTNAGIAGTWLPYFKVFIMLFILILIAYISLLISKRLIVKLLHAFFARTTTRWDDLLIENKLFDNLAHIVPVLIIRALAPVVFIDFEPLLSFVLMVTDIYIVIVIMLVIMSLLKGMEFFLSTSPAFKDKPLASYFQLTRIIIYIAVGILILSTLMGRSPVYFLSAFGAMTAIILLIFKDTILGLVASVQISANDMVRVGDWVEMPKFNADGDVIAMNLNTVKIINWDKTVTTVPTYYFITDSFKNWRGMQESGGRRIKRSIYINLRSIKFVNEEMRERFERFYIIKDFVSQRQQEIKRYNFENSVDTTELINGRRMTNIGVFRQYTDAFLKSHPGVNQNMIIMVRQLQPVGEGLPMEIYCFTKSIDWVEYEGTQADIFDHLISAAAHFELEVFQNPSGSDVILAGENLNRYAL